jgi:hypothetical protein
MYCSWERNRPSDVDPKEVRERAKISHSKVTTQLVDDRME